MCLRSSDTVDDCKPLMTGHLQHATGQHLELTRKGLLDARRRGEDFRRMVVGLYKFNPVDP